MGGIQTFSKRTRRYIGAVIATGVTTFVAMMTALEADAEACGLQDATLWQLALHDAEVEQSPDYVRSVTEAFLAACPNRPEVPEAHRIAGRAATDMDDAAAAAAHFRKAGPMTELTSNFYAIAAFTGDGDPASAWRTRDRMVEIWRSRLDRNPSVSVSAEPLQDGIIYQVYFSETDRNTGTRAAWVAVPFGPGLPATLSFSQDRFRMGIRKVRASSDVDFRYVDFHRCHGRRILGRIDTKIATGEFDEAARASLTNYLATPDLPSTSVNDPVQVCVFPSRLLPGVPKP